MVVGESGVGVLNVKKNLYTTIINNFKFKHVKSFTSDMFKKGIEKFLGLRNLNLFLLGYSEDEYVKYVISSILHDGSERKTWPWIKFFGVSVKDVRVAGSCKNKTLKNPPTRHRQFSKCFVYKFYPRDRQRLRWTSRVEHWFYDRFVKVPHIVMTFQQNHFINRLTIIIIVLSYLSILLVCFSRKYVVRLVR